jgi:hypothetical protein
MRGHYLDGDNAIRLPHVHHLEVSIDIRQFNVRIAIRVPHARGGHASAAPPLSHISGMVQASCGMCRPVATAISMAIASADPTIVSVVGFGMLGSPVSRVYAPSSLLASGVATGTLAIAKSRIGFKPLTTNAATMNKAVAHRGFSRETSCF